MAAPWIATSKAVTLSGHEQHSPSLAGYKPPPPCKTLVFTPADLALSIGRNLALSTAPQSIVTGQGLGALRAIRDFVDEVGSDFGLTPDVDHLGDVALTQTAHHLGVGVSGLYMEGLGYLWRANGKEVLAKVKGQGMPDYVWSTGSVSGDVVLSEAKGAAASKALFKDLDDRAKKGFADQVRPWIGGSLKGGGTIVWGYGIGTHAAGGTSPARLVVHEPEPVLAALPRSSGGGPGVGAQVAPKAVLSDHIASLFLLAGSQGLANAFRGGEGRRDRETTKFAVLVARGRRFVLALEPRMDVWWPWPLAWLSRDGRHLRFAMAIEMDAAARYLRLLDGEVLRGEGLLDVSDLLTEPQSGDAFAVAADGLALLEEAALEGEVEWVRGVGFN